MTQEKDIVPVTRCVIMFSEDNAFAVARSVEGTEEQVNRTWKSLILGRFKNRGYSGVNMNLLAETGTYFFAQDIALRLRRTKITKYVNGTNNN
jgi:hypothetical protein